MRSVLKPELRLADKLAREFVLARDRVCVCCGTDRDLEWAHILTRGARYLRWEMYPTNSLALCHGDHAYFTTHPKEFRRFVAEKFGPDHRDRLLRMQAEAERRGDSVDVTAVIRGFREHQLTPAEMEKYRSGAWLG